MDLYLSVQQSMKNILIFSYFVILQQWITVLFWILSHISVLTSSALTQRLKNEIFQVTQGVLKRAHEIQSCMLERNAVKSAG